MKKLLVRTQATYDIVTACVIAYVTTVYCCDCPLSDATSDATLPAGPGTSLFSILAPYKFTALLDGYVLPSFIIHR